MNALILKTGTLISGLLFLALAGSSAAAAQTQEAVLKKQLISYLEGMDQPETNAPAQALSSLRVHPITATTAYLLLYSDPVLLKKFYPDISRTVMQLFSQANTTDDGLVRAASGAPAGTGASLSPGLNALAALELYSLHLIAWKAGAYEDALEFLAWSNSLSDAVTQRFLDPRRHCFYPINGNGKFAAAHEPGQLLPLILDQDLGPDTRGRIASEYLERNASSPEAKLTRFLAYDPWDDPAMRFVVVDLLAGTLPADGELLTALRASAESSMPEAAPLQRPWIDFWRDDHLICERLFPPWKTISSLVNLMLLFEREAFVEPKELEELGDGVDSLVAMLSEERMSVESYQAATSGVNRFLAKMSRFSELLESKKERWRVIDETKWLTLSPRIKRLITETLAGSLPELGRFKADLSSRLERDGGLLFRLDLPEGPVSGGRPIPFTASLQTLRDTVAASQPYVQIGDMRWKMMESDKVVTLTGGGAPLVYEGTMTLPPTAEPGIITLPSIIDFAHDGGRIEIHRIGSVALAKQYDAELDLPKGRRIGNSPVPVDIALTGKSDHDIRGTVEGTFLREFVTAPPLPAHFIAKKDSERTDLALTIAPKGIISPGRYPFSLTVVLDGTPIALFEESLIKPFRWLHLGPLTKQDDALRNPLSLQANLLRKYTTADGRAIQWREAPAGAIDAEGALWPQRLYGKVPGGCMLLYTVVDCPARTKLLWKLLTNNSVCLWINSEPILTGTENPSNEATGQIELRKGPNSFLISASWRDSPRGILLEMTDENGLPPTGMSNEIDAIVDGYDRLTAPESETREEKPAPDQMRSIAFKYINSGAAEVSVIGSFNNWDPVTTPMRRESKGAWTVRLALRPGKYTYKFLVNRKQKVLDPANPATEPDGFGGSNSVLEVR
ncbi:MAG: isoamylase early set domain-containing protein [Candidatus Krumholzibacteria bacterium]|nr:isoamylase early set domain-containing protein [Candidatus Krumholzibacteria bacterium]